MCEKIEYVKNIFNVFFNYYLMKIKDIKNK